MPPVVARLEFDQSGLRSELSGLRQELAVRQQAAAANTGRLAELKSELDRQQLLAGLVAVHGPGVTVVLDDAHGLARPGAVPEDYLIHEYDLRDVVNLLWMAGSEAIAVNDERLVSNSSIYCVGSTVMVNSTRLAPPYKITAVGNSRVQQDVLRNPSYLENLKQRAQDYGVEFGVTAARDLTLPPYRGGFLIRHAQPGE